MLRLSNNGKVKIEQITNGCKVISKTNNSTPGAFKIFNVKPHSTYHVKINYGSYKGKIILWVATMKNTKIEFNGRICMNRKHSSVDHYFRNGIHTKVKIGFLFLQPKIGDYYELQSINIIESNKSNSKKRLAIVVPYRDRLEHLTQFVPHMDKFLNTSNTVFRTI